MAKNMSFNGELFEIFSRLPANTLHKFASAAKPCLDLLHETHFMEKQCTNSLHKTEESIFMDDGHNHCLYEKENCKVFFRALPDTQPSTNAYGLPPESLAFLAKEGRIIASSNGLLLCRNVPASKFSNLLFLCNPTTRTWLPIRLPNEHVLRPWWPIHAVLLCGGGSYSYSKNNFPRDYTLILFQLDLTEEEWLNPYKVYVLEDNNRWVFKTVVQEMWVDFSHPVQCDENLLLFMSESIARRAEPYILCFDVEKWTTTSLALPREVCDDYYSHLNDSNLQIFGWDPISEENKSCFKTLALVISRRSVFSVWVLEDIKDPKSWHKLIREVDLAHEPGISCNNWYMRFQCILIAKQLIFATREYIYSYVLEGSERGKLTLICENECERGSMRFHPFSTTLRPCCNL